MNESEWKLLEDFAIMIAGSPLSDALLKLLKCCRTLNERSAEPVGSVPVFGIWYDVEKTLPVGTEVIGWDGEMVTTFFPATGKPPDCGIERCRYLGITHWMPLPNPPNKELSGTEPAAGDK